ncbi:MAG: aminotransferase class I/II-fold pyridoxal phosphate-dependent enzyme, partial [Chthoniobacteraceae bacterium]
EAHAIGVIGEHGRGLAEQCGLSREIDVQMGTLSKALGCSGGYICGSRRLIDLLINRARSFIYSTALPPAVAAAATAAVEFLMSPKGESRRQVLRRNVAEFAGEMAHLFPDGKKVQSAIVPVVLGRSEAALEASQMLADRGFFVPAIRYPTVPAGAARLRVTISAKHPARQIADLGAALRELPVVPHPHAAEE